MRSFSLKEQVSLDFIESWPVRDIWNNSKPLWNYRGSFNLKNRNPWPQHFPKSNPNVSRLSWSNAECKCCWQFDMVLKFPLGANSNVCGLDPCTAKASSKCEKHRWFSVILSQTSYDVLSHLEEGPGSYFDEHSFHVFLKAVFGCYIETSNQVIKWIGEWTMKQ